MLNEYITERRIMLGVAKHELILNIMLLIFGTWLAVFGHVIGLILVAFIALFVQSLEVTRRGNVAERLLPVSYENRMKQLMFNSTMEMILLSVCVAVNFIILHFKHPSVDFINNIPCWAVAFITYILSLYHKQVVMVYEAASTKEHLTDEIKKLDGGNRSFLKKSGKGWIYIATTVSAFMLASNAFDILFGEVDTLMPATQMIVFGVCDIIIVIDIIATINKRRVNIKY